MGDTTKAEKARRASLLERGLKYCPSCDEVKPVGAFAVNKATGDGYQSYCRQCYHDIYAADVERRADWQKAYAQEHEQEVTARNQAYYLEHADELKERQRAYYWTHRLRARETNRRYVRTRSGRQARQVASARRKMREASLPSDLTTEEWRFALAFFGHRCAYCGTAQEGLEQEHYIPVVMGGGLTASNVVPACHQCNQSKKAAHPEEWMERTGIVSEMASTRIKEYLSYGSASQII